MSIKARMKKRLKNYLFPAVHLYRTYKYNLYTEQKRRPSNLIRNLITTTQKVTGKRKTILFYPDTPFSGSVICQILYFLGYDITNDPEDKFDFVLKWKDATFSPRDHILRRLAAQNINIININCEDISKLYVDQVFHTVFGYSVMVDPLRYTGKCVVKSNLNAQGGEKIISCPIDTIETGVIYSKLINNEVEDGMVLNYRVPVFKQVIPFVYLKKNTVKQRLNGFISVQLAQVYDVFSEDEICKILSFCQRIGLDYGELDILRDKEDKQLYIIDANNTPYSTILHSDPLRLPPNKRLMSPNDRLIMLQELAQSFKNMLTRETKSMGEEPVMELDFRMPK